MKRQSSVKVHVEVVVTDDFLLLKNLTIYKR